VVLGVTVLSIGDQDTKKPRPRENGGQKKEPENIEIVPDPKNERGENSLRSCYFQSWPGGKGTTESGGSRKENVLP